MPRTTDKPKPKSGDSRPRTRAGEVPGAPPKAAMPRSAGLKVRATETGYYDHGRRRPGDVFVIAKEEDFSTRWMEYVDARTPEKTTGAQAALKEAHDRLRSDAAAVPAASVGPDNPTGAQGVIT